MRQSLFNAAAPIYFVGTFLRFYSTSPAVFLVLTASLVGYGLFLLWPSIKCVPSNSLSLSIMALMVASALLNMVFGESDNVFVVLQFVSNVGFALAVIHARLKPNLFLTLFLSLSIFFAYNIAWHIDPEGVFSVSRNFISVLIILCVAFYYFACEQNNLQPNLVVPCLSMLIMLWAIGRAGIGSGALILVWTLILSRKKKTLVLAGIFFAAGLLHWQAEFRMDFASLYTGIERFERLSGDGQRNYINSEYLTRISEHERELLFGAPLDEISSIVEVDGNAHNSYIRLHAFFGLSGASVFLSSVLFAIVALARKRKNLLLLILIVALFRSAFDSTAFHGPLDVVIFYCIAIASRSTKIVLRPYRGVKWES